MIFREKVKETKKRKQIKDKREEEVKSSLSHMIPFINHHINVFLLTTALKYSPRNSNYKEAPNIPIVSTVTMLLYTLQTR